MLTLDGLSSTQIVDEYLTAPLALAPGHVSVEWRVPILDAVHILDPAMALGRGPSVASVFRSM